MGPAANAGSAWQAIDETAAGYIDLPFAHTYEIGAMRRMYLHARDAIRKRLLVHEGAFNLSRVF
jgi:hypothetical protein